MIHHRNRCAVTCPQCEDPFVITERDMLRALSARSNPSEAERYTCPHCGHVDTFDKFAGQDVGCKDASAEGEE